MQIRNKKANVIIILIVILLLMLLLVIQAMLTILKQEETAQKEIQIATGNNNEKSTTIEEIIEKSGSRYISTEKVVFIKVFVDFKYDLYDENGKSKEKYFLDIIEQIVEITKEDFYLIDENKNIEIYVHYDIEKDKYTVRINGTDDFYKDTDGQTYIEIENTQIVKQQPFAMTNNLYTELRLHDMRYANTVIVTSEKEEMSNGYLYYPTEHIKVKLGGEKVLNIIYDKNYEEEISINTYVGTKLEDVVSLYTEPGFGSVKEKFLGYRNKEYYVFIYEDEISVYQYKYKENEYFDKYLTDYCETGDLDKLVSDFTTEWSTYFEFDYDAENQNLKLTFPTRGIDIDIKNNDSRGIKIYNNYYLTDAVKDLIKKNKITLESDKDLLFITEQKRRESMK